MKLKDNGGNKKAIKEYSIAMAEVLKVGCTENNGKIPCWGFGIGFLTSDF